MGEGDPQAEEDDDPQGELGLEGEEVFFQEGAVKEEVGHWEEGGSESSILTRFLLVVCINWPA